MWDEMFSQILFYDANIFITLMVQAELSNQIQLNTKPWKNFSTDHFNALLSHSAHSHQWQSPELTLRRTFKQ